MNTTTNPTLPQYVCTTQFQAAKILEILDPHPVNPKMYGLALELEEGKMELQLVHEGYIQRNWPQVGGYFLRTAAGHARYLSAEEFEQDYARVPDMQPVALAEIELLAGQQWMAPNINPDSKVAQMMRAMTDDAEAMMGIRKQAEVVFRTMRPEESQNLNAAPHYEDILGPKNGRT